MCVTHYKRFINIVNLRIHQYICYMLNSFFSYFKYNLEMCLNQKRAQLLYQIHMQHCVIVNDQSMTIEGVAESNPQNIVCLKASIVKFYV